MQNHGRGTARRDLWTPGIALVWAQLTDRLSEDEREGARVVAELGPSLVEHVRAVVPWNVVTALDDSGLIGFVEAEGAGWTLFVAGLAVLSIARVVRSRAARAAVADIDCDGR